MNYRSTMKVNDKGHLEIGGCDCVGLAEKYGTPLYIMDEEYVRSVCRAFRQTIAQTYGEGNMAYASKAFSCKAIYNIMKQEGTCIDVVSGGEIYTAASAGFDMSRAFFHGNNKLDGELDLAMQAGVGTIVVDAADDAERINEYAKKYGRVQKVLVRVNPGVEAHTHSYIQTAKVDSKFGFSIKSGAAEKAIKDVASRSNLKFSGVHCHIGSQIFDRSAFALAVDVMTDFIKQLQEDGITVDVLNLGGGFGVHYTEEDPKYNVGEYCDYVKLLTQTLSDCVERKKIKKPVFIIEPGRAIVGEAGVTLYSVGAIKDIEGVRKYVAIDGGMTDNIRPALYEAKYEAVLANRVNDKPEEVVTIAGKCCESGDIIIKDIKLPKTKRGDLLAVFTTGAYCYSMASNYNRNVIPPVVFVRGGKSGYAVRPQTYEDLARLAVIPDTEQYRVLIYQIFTSGNFVSGLLMLLAIVIVGAFAIMLHEVAHGYAAYLNGDFTAKYAGRLTLNPLKHFDIFGTIMMLIVGFGWAKPVPIDSRNFTNYRKGMLMTSLAGVTMNLILAVVALIGLCIVTAVFGAANVIVGYGGSMYYATASMAARYAYEFFYYLCAYGVTINMTLFLFNLIPIYPLDGFRVVETLAKPDNAYVRFNYRYGNFLLIGVILIFTVLGYIASYIGVNLNIFGQYQNLFIRLMNIIQNSILGGM